MDRQDWEIMKFFVTLYGTIALGVWIIAFLDYLGRRQEQRNRKS